MQEPFYGQEAINYNWPVRELKRAVLTNEEEIKFEILKEMRNINNEV